MSEPAAFRATYSDFRLIKGRKVVQFVFEVPIEESNKAFQALGGMPDPGSSVWCAVARLVNPTEKTAHKPPPSPHPEPAGATRKPVAPEKRLAQKAALLCKDSLFRKFLTLNTHYADDEPTVAQYLRVLCNVDSRSEIIPGTSAAEKFEDIATRFVVWRDLPDREDAE